MQNTSLLTGLLLLAILGCQGADQLDPPADRPNIIVILSDDMGYSDLGCFGGEVDTPNLDALAENGLRFTQFYNTARCCPTRASLMTGCYPHQTGIGHMTNTPKNVQQHDLEIPPYRGFLNQNCVTLAEVLGAAGYSTLMSGKWHLGLRDSTKWPLQRGFDHFYGLIPGASNFFKPTHPRGITVGNTPIEITDPEYYTTDAFTDAAIAFIDTAKAEHPSQPFFLYLAYTAPHWPLQAPAEVVEKYLGRYTEGWDRLRAERYARMQEMGLLEPSWELPPADAPSWDTLSQAKRMELDLRRAIYSAMIDRMDQNIGRLVAHLEARQLKENTLILFLNDNGACAEFAMLGSGPAEQLGTKEGYVLSYGRAWANASNTPYREYKHWLHEGGIATPFIAHWPRGIPEARGGDLVHQYGFLPDIMATVVELAETEYPTEFNGHTITPTAGKSLLPLFAKSETAIHSEPLFWEHEGNKAVRLGAYKLVSKWKPKRETNWELYHIPTDRTELNDLAASMPDKTTEMAVLYEAWAAENDILPFSEVRTRMEELRKKRAQTQ